MTYWEGELTVGPGEHELEFRSQDAFKLRRLSLQAAKRPHDYELLEGELLAASDRVRARFSNLSDGPLTLTVRTWLNDVPTPAEIRTRYRSEVSRADAAIGRLLESLRRRGLYENTLVIVTSDHGEALGEHGTIGHVETLYDELLHVPLIIRLPHGRIDSALVASREDLVRHIDLAPTILDELGFEDLPDPAGSSLFGASARTLLAETHPPEATRTLFCARDDQYKLIFAPDTDEFELFRLGPDPLELDNVFSHQGHLRETWQKVLHKLAREVSPDHARAESTRAKLSALGY
jgi:arylsulfatase A-like enzyme